MNLLVSGAFSTTEHHASTGHHAGHSLVDTVLNGAAWRIGSDVANMLFHAAPAAMLVVAAVAAAIYFLRRSKRRNQN